MKKLPIGSVLLVLGLTPALFGQAGQSFDNSGNSLLSGTYFVRQVLYDQFDSNSAPTRGTSLTGTMTFDGKGSYSFTGQKSVSDTSGGTPKASTSTGAYFVSASGLLKMDDPLSSGEFVFGGVGTSAFVASCTESVNVLDVMIGVPISSSVSNSSLSGQYRVGAIDFTGAKVTQTRNASFLVNADGNGNLGSISLLGQAANANDTEGTQTVSGATYTLNGTNNTITFPLASGQSATTQFVSGPKQFAVSSDGNIFVGGGLNTYDFVVGIKAGSGDNTSYSGIYYSGGLDYDNSSNYFDTFYGSVNSNGQGTAIAHQRVAPSDSTTYDYTVDDEFTVAAGTVTETYQRFFAGAGGTAVLAVGRSNAYSLILSVVGKTLPPTGPVVINPLAIVNAANYAPITNPVAPGEMVILYGAGLSSSSATATTTPFPTTLGNNVSVTVNDVAAPLYSVSPTQIVAIVPWAVDVNNGSSFAQFKVKNNGTTSNTVTLFLDTAAPGVFTLGQNGIADAAALHANGTVVSSASPARVGETVSFFTTGLGAVNPTVADGAPGPSKPLSNTTDSFSVWVDGVEATTPFAGLAPGLVGLNQINFTIPSGVSTGKVYVQISDDSNFAFNDMAALVIGSGTASTAVPAVRQPRARVQAARKGLMKNRLQGHTQRGVR